jgi:thymidylate synthase (FAD)
MSPTSFGGAVTDGIEFRSHPTVELIDWMPKDVTVGERVVQAARVSSGTEASGATPTANAGLLRMLQRDRHGSPFEHAVFTWRIECPVFVSREFFRHRIASYNETSSRYRVMEPVFYVPPPERPLVQIGKPGAYRFEAGDQAQYETVVELHKSTAEVAWHDYQEMLAAGVAREVARNVLPLSLYTSFYVTMNLRSFENFASLRRGTEESQVPTMPLWEIAQVCDLMERDVQELAPEIWTYFNNTGRRPV